MTDLTAPGSAPDRFRETPGVPRQHRFGAVAEVTALSFLIGGFTAYAQGFLPEAIGPVANSASGWTIVTVALLWSVRARPPAAMVLGAVSFVLLTLGYTMASGLRGHTYDPTLFGLVGVVAGPVVGLATAWLREQGLRAALATAVLSGIGIGEALYGLTVIADSTSPVYWSIVGLGGAGLVGWTVLRRLHDSVSITLALGLTAVFAATFLVAYQRLGGF
ncbi:DUF6518 family protein [Kineosporia succinea]|uniref:Uncharacterized protein n=1 Tax=Kineosporia succinea TaxID=84632 RepID=A0ABT9P9A3_9ACTN|nr:DUF6518 family protein [Kineosporia succinea]MDP9829279.1 hypothetical protein [Kineosporia succinea]